MLGVERTCRWQVVGRRSSRDVEVEAYCHVSIDHLDGRSHYIDLDIIITIIRLIKCLGSLQTLKYIFDQNDSEYERHGRDLLALI